MQQTFSFNRAFIAIAERIGKSPSSGIYSHVVHRPPIHRYRAHALRRSGRTLSMSPFRQAWKYVAATSSGVALRSGVALCADSMAPTLRRAAAHS